MTCNFTELSDDEFYEALMEANEILINNYYDKLKKQTKKLLDYI